MSHAIGECYPVYKETNRRARVAHACDACGDTIEPGHRYTHLGYVWDGKAETVKRCLRCQAIHVHLRDLGQGDYWPAEKLDCGESYQSHWEEDPPPEIAALAFQTGADLQKTDGDA